MQTRAWRSQDHRQTLIWDLKRDNGDGHEYLIILEKLFNRFENPEIC